MTTTILAAITAPPVNIVQSGARVASSAAVMSHADANPKVAITKRATRETLGLATAAASASKTATSANTAEMPIGDVMAADPSSQADRTITAARLGSGPERLDGLDH